ncbi:MAG: transposase [Defluviitaleaceae bacterium]|nr:transposase [Defluviitaleaceae bacterium]
MPKEGAIKSNTKSEIKKWETSAKLDQISQWRNEGLTMEQVAKEMGIHARTLYNWSLKSEKIKKALEIGEEMLLDELEETLYMRAKGFTKIVFEPIKLATETISKGTRKREERTEIVDYEKYFPPNVTALIFALASRRNGKWRRKDRDDKEIAELKALQENLYKLIDSKLLEMSQEELRRILDGGNN